MPYKTPDQARGYASAFVAALGCADVEDETACLLAAPADRVVAAQAKTPVVAGLLLGLPSFVPWSPVLGSEPLREQPNPRASTSR